MALGGGQVDQPALAQQEEAPAVRQPELLDEGPHLSPSFGHLLQRRDVDLDVEVAGVGHDGAVLHRLEVLAVDDVDVAGERDEDVADAARPRPAA